MNLRSIKDKEVLVYMVDNNNKLEILENLKNLFNLFKYIDINFCTINLNEDDLRNFNNSLLKTKLEMIKMKYYLLDIPEYAKGSLLEEILQKEERISELTDEYLILDNKDTNKAHSFLSWIDMLIHSYSQLMPLKTNILKL